MDRVEVIPVIRTTLLRRGTGKDEDSPIRIITQYWLLTGDLLFEHDPFVDSFPKREGLI